LQLLVPSLRHWFVIPIALCGAVIGSDAIDWLRGRVDLFDPVGILGLLGVHFFFGAPLMHVASDYWMGYIVPPADWRPWLGGMAILNFCGLLLFRAARVCRLSRHRTRDVAVSWTLNRRLFPYVLIAGLFLTMALQIAVYRRYGGVLGFIRSYEAREGAFTGMGWVFMISESFPILAFIGYAVYAQRHNWARSRCAVAVALLLFLMLRILFGGLRGSRSNTIWALFWAVGIVHLAIRPLSRRAIYAGIVFLVAFMYVYGFYKSGGLDGLLAARDTTERAVFEEQTGRTLEATLLGDLARADIQAFILYRLCQYPDEYDLALGRSYVGDLAILIPRGLWPDRPPSKVKEGTEAQYGKGSWLPGTWSSSKVYGLGGEAMLNFGPFSVPLAYAVLGVVVNIVRRACQTWAPTDIRRLLLPFCVNLCIVVLVGDLDNVVYFAVVGSAVPILVLWLSSSVGRDHRDGTALVDIALHSLSIGREARSCPPSVARYGRRG